MKKPNWIVLLVLTGSILLQLNTLCLRAHAAPGDVDLSFDPGSGINGVVKTVAVQPDGKVLIAGQFTTVKGLARTNLARLNPDGSGDSSFNAGASIGTVSAMALLPDGKVLIGGTSVVRLNSDGTLDNSFVAATGWYPYGNSFESIVVQPDGKVLLGGTFGDIYVDVNTGNTGETLRYLVIRLNPDGTSDTGFTTAIGPADDSTDIVSVALQPDNKVIFGGGSVSSGPYVARLNADGSADNTFNFGTGLNYYFFSLAVQPDGKVLLGGYFTTVIGTNRNGIARLNADGSLDNSFDPGTGADNVSRIALQPDGKVLLFGFFTSVNGTNRAGIARLNANGSLDGSFDPGSGIGGYYPAIKSFGVQADGKILIVGDFITVNGATHHRAARFNANGSLDSTFDAGTAISASPHTSYTGVKSVSVQPDGKLLIGGGFITINGANRNGIARLNANGSLDSSFNPGTGAISFPNLINGNGEVRSIAVQPNGKVLIGGTFTTVNGTSRHNLARLNADGSLDGSHDPVTNASSSRVNAVVLQPDGKVLVGMSPFDGANRRWMARLKPDGSLDGSFNPDFSGFPDFVEVISFALQADGKVLVGGARDAGGSLAHLLTRLNSDGSLDPGFEPAIGQTEPNNAAVEVVAVQPDGKILVGGSFSTFKGAPRNRIARLNADGTLDAGFNPGLGATGNSGHPWFPTPGVRSLAIQTDGKVLIGGNFNSVNGANRCGIARLNPDGSLDVSFNPGGGAAGTVYSLALQSNGNMMVAGDFSIVNGAARPHVARLYGDAFPPSLSITRAGASIALSWPATALNFQLQESTNLALPNSWSPVAQLAVTNGAQIAATVPTSGERKFFRLKSQ